MLCNVEDWRSAVAAGLCFGLATTLRSNLVLLLPVFVFFTLLSKRPPKKIILFAATYCLGIAPITLANYLMSDNFVPLSTSGGQNFYLGYYEGAGAGYIAPEEWDGDISVNMRAYAEQQSGHAMSFKDASSYFMNKAIDIIVADPYRALDLMLQKGLAFINNYEAMTYADYYLQMRRSPVLQYSLSTGLLLVLTFLLLLQFPRRNVLYVLIPVFISFVSVVLFFFISRMRMPAIPFLAMASSVAVSGILDFNRIQRTLALPLLLGALVVVYHDNNIINVSNELNKEALIYVYEQKYDRAEALFREAMAEDPHNPHSYLNLADMLRKMNRLEEADLLQSRGESLMPKRD